MSDILHFLYTETCSINRRILIHLFKHNQPKGRTLHRYSHSFNWNLSFRFRSNSPKRVIKKCAFDIDSLLKPTNNSSYIDDTEDNSSDDGHVHRESFSSPISSYALVNQLKTNEKFILSSSFDSEHSMTSHSKNKSKRIRTIFTTEQLERLEAEFEKQQYMVGSERLYLAQELHLSEGQVKVNPPPILFLHDHYFFKDLVSKSSYKMAPSNC